MSLKLHQRYGEEWYVTGTQFGQRIRRSTGTADRAQAEVFLAKLQKDAFEHRAFGPQATVTFLEAARSYLKAGKGGKNPTFLARLLYKDFRQEVPKDHTELALMKLRAIDQDCLDKLRDEFFPNLKGSSLDRCLYTPINAVLTHAATRKWCAVPKFDRPKHGGGRTRWLTVEDAERLVLECRPYFRPLIVFLLGTGCRLSEALYLDWRQVDLAAGHANIIGTTEDDDDEIGTKSGRERNVPLTARVIAELRALGPQTAGAVFRKRNGEPWARPDDEGLGGRRVHVALNATAERAGLTHVHPHLMRHTFATWHTMYGTHQFELMRLGGWASVSNVKRYSHNEGIRLTPDQRAAIAAWIDRDAAPATPAFAGARLRVVV